jgi:hypothetical protein
MAYLYAPVNPLVELKCLLGISDICGALGICDPSRISDVHVQRGIHDMLRISDVCGPLGSCMMIHLSGSLYCLGDHLSLQVIIDIMIYCPNI